MSEIKIYNTMTGKKEKFEPQQPGKVNMYVCGPTVYDYIHIGNARPMIFFDVVRRFLAYSGYDVTYVVNFTDVDDKLIRRSEETGEAVPVLADRFIHHYFEDASGLAVREADVHPRVTGHMEQIIAFIRDLEERGLAYESGGDVYFRTAKFPEYGKLSGQKTEDLQYGIRIQVDERKEDPRDFVLWKKAKDGEISWDSPWGKGRPGWHIECSAMARTLLGDTLDIHGGGHDLMFPHHECEIAQSESLTGKPLARYWMHNGYIQIRDEKMSKSLGNVVNVRDLLGKWRPEVIRFFMLATHYRNPLHFSEEALGQAEGAVERIENAVLGLRHRLQAIPAETAVGPDPEEDAYVARLPELEAAFAARMGDDFNTADAIAVLFEWVSETNVLLKRERLSRPTLEAALAWLERINGVLHIAATEEAGLLDEEVEQLIAERQAARQAKNWARADEIRDLLAARGIVLEDTPQGLRWRRK